MSGEPRTEQEIVQRFQQLMEEREQLTAASIERQQEVAEHDLVLKTLEPLEPQRKCFRLVGEVLVDGDGPPVLLIHGAASILRELPSALNGQLAGLRTFGWDYQQRGLVATVTTAGGWW